MEEFKCFICGKSYGYKISLKVHMLKHDSTTIIKCGVCSKRFSQENNLYSHIKQFHGFARGSIMMKNAMKVHKGTLLNCDQATSTGTSHGEHDEPAVVPCTEATAAVTFTRDREPTGAVTETNYTPPSLPQQSQSYTENRDEYRVDIGGLHLPIRDQTKVFVKANAEIISSNSNEEAEDSSSDSSSSCDSCSSSSCDSYSSSSCDSSSSSDSSCDVQDSSDDDSVIENYLTPAKKIRCPNCSTVMTLYTDNVYDTCKVCKHHLE